MTDRELLELAAKAAGIVGNHPNDIDAGLFLAVIDDETWLQSVDDGGLCTYWNPLRDDGDALRLAVKLKMKLEHYSVTSKGQDRVSANNASPVSYEDDSYTATRRAIVCAAAEVGRAMK